MIRKVAPVVILLVLGGIAWTISSNPASMDRRPPPQGPRTVVEVAPVEVGGFQVNVASYGTVQPRTQSLLVAQVSGQILSVAENFRPGGVFQAGDVLATIDPRDYEADVSIAEATYMDAVQALAQEQARAEQALIDWQKLGDAGETPSDLVLRKPQLQAAKARVASAESNLVKAKLNLERTSIVAPFAGRVLTQNADVGQVLNMGSQLGEVFATDYVEVRLPIRNAELAFVNLPEGQTDSPVNVRFRSELGSITEWQGQIVRTEGAIDQVSRQLHVVAQIDDPFTAQGDRRPLKIGEYMTAEISGRELAAAIVIPTNTVYQNAFVYVVEEGVLARRDVEIAWQNGAEALISSGLRGGEMLVTTPLGQVASGTQVRIAGTELSSGSARPQAGSEVAR